MSFAHWFYGVLRAEMMLGWVRFEFKDVNWNKHIGWCAEGVSSDDRG